MAQFQDPGVRPDTILTLVQWTTRITETGITNLTRITNEMAASSDYLMEYFNGILAVLLE